ncbi:MAG: hypothetical protein WCK90_02055 [archaeon]
MYKRGQFFLIAAVIIVFVLLGLGTIYSNTSATKEDGSYYDRSNEASFEGARLLDYGTFNSISDQGVQDIMKNLTDYYSSLSPDTEFLFIYGNSSGLTKITITPPSTNSIVTSNIVPSPGSNNITVNFSSGENITLDLSNGKVFYTFSIKNRGDEHLAKTK